MPEIRLEDSIDEAKIAQPLEFSESLLDDSEALARSVHETEEGRLRSLSQVTKKYRQG